MQRLTAIICGCFLNFLSEKTNHRSNNIVIMTKIHLLLYLTHMNSIVAVKWILCLSSQLRIYFYKTEFYFLLGSVATGHSNDNGFGRWLRRNKTETRYHQIWLASRHPSKKPWKQKPLVNHWCGKTICNFFLLLYSLA